MRLTTTLARPATSEREAPVGAHRSWLTLRVTLLALVLGLLLATISALATINYASQTRSLEDLEGRYFALASETVAGQIQAALQPAAPSLNEAVYSASTLGTLAVDDDAALVDFELTRMQFADGLTFLYYGSAATGRFVGVRREGDGTLVVSRSSPDVDGGRRREEGVAPDGSRFPWPSNLPGGYDARVRPWFQAATTSATTAWTGPYVFFTQQELGITASRPLRDPAGQLVGVFGVDVTIRDLRSLLASLVRDADGRAYIVDRGGTIIASSSDSSGPEPPAALSAALAQAPTSLRTLPVATPLAFGFEHAGERWLAALQMFPLQGDVEWGTVYLIPERAFLQTVYEYQRVALGLGLALVLLAIVLAVRLSQGVARPLGLLATDLARVGHFELSDRPSPRSRIHEVMVLGDAVDRMKSSVRSFARYVPAEVVRDVLARGEEARLGGAPRTLTVQFTDIENFTTLSEGLTAAQVVAYLSDYLRLMTAAAHEYGGTVNQFLGDGIVVLFNAPATVPDHAAQACRAALRAQEALEAAHEQWTAAGRPAFRTRIGLHSGEVLVGTFGTPERFAYTAIGDAMNVASRLEGLNKMYGTRILGSAAVRETAGTGFEWRTLDRVAVAGRSGGIEISELLGETGQVAPLVLEGRDQYEAALALYFAEQFETAADAFRAVAAVQPGDRAARLMAQRAELYARFPPAPDWQGIFVHTTK